MADASSSRWTPSSLRSAASGRISEMPRSTLSGFTLADELAHVLVRRLGDDLLRRAHLDDASALHDRDAAADLERLVEVVADEEDGPLHGALNCQQLVLQALADQRIEGRVGLVHEQDLGIGGEGAGEAHALLHAAGELVRMVVEPGTEPHLLQHLRYTLAALGPGHAAYLQPERDIIGDGAPRHQRELLEDHGDALPSAACA